MRAVETKTDEGGGRVNEKLLYCLIAALLAAIMICIASCKATWWIGHDNGEAYEAYTEAMEEYRDER